MSRRTKYSATCRSTGAFSRKRRLTTLLALLRIEGVVGPFRPRLARDLRLADRPIELFEQLRPLPLPGEADPAGGADALEGQELPVYGQGINVRDWLYVDDHARALELVATTGKNGESYAIGGRSEQANLSVVESICDALDAKVPLTDGRSRGELIRFVTDRPGHDRRYAIDPSKIERELGWRAEQTFESGLEATIDWYLANEWWWHDPRAAIRGQEAGRRLVKILVTGVEGQLARSLVERSASHEGIDLVAIGRPQRTSPFQGAPLPR